MNISKLTVISISFCLISSCCGLLDGMRLYDYSSSDKVYHFDMSVYELAEKLNKASSRYYLERQNLNEKIELCNSPEEYSNWTKCFNDKENSFQRCGYQEQYVFNEKTKEQADSSYLTCWVELKLIDLDKISSIDTLEIYNDFGRIVLIGNQKTSQLSTPLGVKVRKEKCLSKKKRKARATMEFEKNIIQEIKN